MRLHEHEAASLFKHAGVPVPPFAVAKNPYEAVAALETIAPPVVLKAQVLVGSRGKHGGIKIANSVEDTWQKADALFKSPVRGFPVEAIMVAQKVAIARELYVGITVDAVAGAITAILGTAGGIDVETVANEQPEALFRKTVVPPGELRGHEARALARQAGLTGDVMLKVADVLVALFRVFRQTDALIAEINPLVVTTDGQVWAVDAVLEVDDAALFRHPDLPKDTLARIAHPIERAAKQIGVSYVDLDGDIAIISSGAGLGMATMDVVGQRLKPANFLETGGGITEELMYKTTELVLQKPGVRGLLINLYGGINPIHEGAKGIVRVLKEKQVKIPVVAKALGNRQEETWATLREAGVIVVTDITTEAAVDALCEALKA